MTTQAEHSIPKQEDRSPSAAGISQDVREEAEYAFVGRESALVVDVSRRDGDRNERGAARGL